MYTFEIDVLYRKDHINLNIATYLVIKIYYHVNNNKVITITFFSLTFNLFVPPITYPITLPQKSKMYRRDGLLKFSEVCISY